MNEKIQKLYNYGEIYNIIVKTEKNFIKKAGIIWNLILLKELIKFKGYSLKQKLLIFLKKVDRDNKFIEYLYSAKYGILQNLYNNEKDFIFLNYNNYPENIRCLFLVLNEIFFEDIYQINKLKIVKNATVIDIGANIGYFSLCLKELYPDLKILAFEPEEENFKNLQQNLKNYKNIELFKVAAGDKEKEAKIIIENRMIAHSMDDEKDYEIRANFKGKQKVNVVRLDDYLKNRKIDLIKMDIEGYEYKAIMGLEKIIKEQKPALLIAVEHSKKQKDKIEKLVFSFNKDYQLKVLNDQNIYFW